ncbi:MAG: S8 family peptidase, partial [Ilumatobacteraceae bacterium]
MTRRPLTTTLLSATTFLLATLTTLAVSTSSASASARADGQATNRGDAIPGRYIVHVKDAANPVAQRVLDESMKFRRSATLDIDDSSDIDAYVTELSDAELTELRSHDAVATIEPDRWISIADTQNSPPSWGLDRIDQVDRPLDSSFTPIGSGSGVTVYVVDTGIAPHPEFAGRLAPGRNFHADNGVVNPANVNDCNGHGTHVAGTAVGSTSGVAKKATVVPLRALGCDGNGMLSAVLAALQWAIDDHPAGAPAVINLSLAGATNATLNAAVQAASNDGIVVVVAAGNSNDDACNWSPASATSVITVGATNSEDVRSSFSNWGTCLDVFAPGSVITSAGLNGGTSTMSGTSMASPHVAGAVAVLWSTNPALTRAQVGSVLAAAATSNRVSGAINGSPNRLLMIGAALPSPTGGNGGAQPVGAGPAPPIPRTGDAFVPVGPTRIGDTRTGLGGVS